MFTRILIKAAVVVIACATSSAWATPINLNWSTTAVGATPSSLVPTTLTFPGSFSFGNSLPSLNANVSGTNSEFFNDYIFTIGSANINSVTTAVDITNLVGISNLQVRLFAVNDATAPGTTGTPTGTLIQAFNNPFSCGPGCSGVNAIIPLQAIAAGTYDLQISGNTEPFGGSYSGVLTTAPVPVPGAAWLLFSGLGALGVLGRKKAS